MDYENRDTRPMSVGDWFVTILILAIPRARNKLTGLQVRFPGELERGENGESSRVARCLESGFYTLCRPNFTAFNKSTREYGFCRKGNPLSRIAGHWDLSSV